MSQSEERSAVDLNFMASGSVRPNKTSDGESPLAWSGVFRCAMMAIMKASVSKEPLGEVASWNSLFTDLTAASALPLDWAKYAGETRWLTPQLRRKSCVSAEVNSRPLSEAISSGTPHYGSQQPDAETSNHSRSDECKNE